MNVHTGTWKEGVPRQSLVFHRENKWFLIISGAYLPDGGFISYRQFSAYHEWPTQGHHVVQRFTKINYWILPVLRMERGQHIPCTVQLDAQSLNAPLLPVANRSTTTHTHTTPHRAATHHTTPNHRTTQRRAAHDMTRHHATKNKDTHVHAHVYVHAHEIYMYFVYVCVCVHVHVGVHISQEEHILKHVPSMMFSVPNP